MHSKKSLANTKVMQQYMLQVVEGAVISCTLLQRGMPGRFNQSVTIYYILINKIDDNKIKCNNKLQREDEHDT
ncbi:hypothetical protein B6A27_05800 [Anoxybacillus sp. UARK-01]|nr:hypothetical protein B6A27_05800 [Anoxybacillus sp. UARK-01]